MSFPFGPKSESKFVRLCQSVSRGSAIPEWEQRHFPDGQSFEEAIRKTGGIEKLNTKSFGYFFGKTKAPYVVIPRKAI